MASDLVDISSLSTDEIRKLISAAEQRPADTLKDVGKQAVAGVGEGVIGLAGLPGDVQALTRMGAEKVAGGPLPADVYSKMPTSADVRSKVEEWTGPFPEAKTGAGKMARTVGEFAPGAAFPGGVVRRGISVLAPALGAEAGEALAGPRGRLVGALAGGVVGARGITPAPATPERMALVKALEAEGVPMTAGQRTGNLPLRWLEAAAADSPISGGRAHALNEATGRAFSGAVMRKIGASGDEIATPDAVNRAVADISRRFNDLSARNTLTPDPQFVNDLVTTAQQYVSRVIPSMRAEGKTNIQGIIQGVTDDIQQAGGQLSGKAYQDTRSRLGKMADGVQEKDPPLADAIRGVRDALDDNMGRSLQPQDQAAWNLARTQWGNWKDLRRAITGAGSATAEGFVSPSQLRASVAGYDRGAYARGQGDMAELARAGEAVLRPLPQSGTGPRMAAANLFASVGGGLIGHTAGGGDLFSTLGGMAAPAIAGRAALSGPAQAYLGNQLLPMTKAEMARRALATALIERPEELRR